MLKEFAIRGFKSLFDVNIELGVVNVFIGANGSGKSNILEALGVLSAASSSIVDDTSIERRGVRVGLPGLYKSSFETQRTPNAILLSAMSADDIFYNVSLYNPIEKPTQSWEFQAEKLNVGGQDIFSAGVRTWRNREVGLATLSLAQSEPDAPEVRFITHLQDYAIYTPNTPTLRGLLPDTVRGALGLQGGSLPDAVQSIMALESEGECLEDALELIDWLDAPEVTTSAAMLLSPAVPRQKKILVFADRHMKKSRNKLTAYDASEGALYVLFALAVSRSPHTLPIFAIDNFDQALNPRLARELAKRFCQWMLKPAQQARQALLTIHNPSTLDALPILDDRVRLFSVDRDNHGMTQVKRIQVTEELRKVAEEKGWPLSRLWVEGHLGGVPNV